MYHFTSPSKNQTLYEVTSKEDLNKAQASNEILELYYNQNSLFSAQGGGSHEPLQSVILIQFDIDRLVEIVNNLGSDYKVFLRLYSCVQSPLSEDYTVTIEEIITPWAETDNSLNFVKISSSSYKEGEGYKSKIKTSLNKSEKSFSESNPKSDLRVEITEIFNSWITENNGVLIRRSPVTESTAQKFFARESNTLWRPELVLKYKDNQTLNSYKRIDANKNEILTAQCTNLKYTYQSGTKETINVKLLRKFSEQKWIEDVRNHKPNYLVNGSIRYKITNLAINKTIIPYSLESTLRFDGREGYKIPLDFTSASSNQMHNLEISKFDGSGQQQDVILSTNYKVI